MKRLLNDSANLLHRPVESPPIEQTLAASELAISNVSAAILGEQRLPGSENAVTEKIYRRLFSA